MIPVIIVRFDIIEMFYDKSLVRVLELFIYAQGCVPVSNKIFFRFLDPPFQINSESDHFKSVSKSDPDTVRVWSQNSSKVILKKQENFLAICQKSKNKNTVDDRSLGPRFNL